MTTREPPQTARPGSGAMFDGIAPRYDLLNRLLSFGVDQSWRSRAVEALALTESQRVLDVATGTADLALRIATSPEKPRVVGLDPSEKMLMIGRQKVERSGLSSRIELVVGEAERLPFGDASFDGVSIAFGIRNVVDRQGALSEMARVTRQGGRVVVLELGEPRGVLAPIARSYVHGIVPFIGALLSGAREYRYLEQSIAAFPPPQEFARSMEDAGLRVVSVSPLTFGACHLYVAESGGVA